MLLFPPPAPALGLVLAALASLPGRGPQDLGALAQREEHFVLELPAATSARTAGPPPMLAVGIACLRRRSSDEGQQAEWELRFFEEGTRVQHVERWSADGPRLVWREWRPGGGRTVLLGPRQTDGGFELIEWGREQRLRTSVEAPDGLLLPLYLLELARRGELRPTVYPVFDPLSRSVERVTVELAFESSGEEQVERLWSLSRTDRTSAGSMRFRGDELVEFRWQGGALVARAVTVDEYREQLARAADEVPGDLVSR